MFSLDNSKFLFCFYAVVLVLSPFLTVKPKIPSFDRPGRINEEQVPASPCDVLSGTCLNPFAFHLAGNFSGYNNNRRYLFEDALDQSQCETLVQVNLLAGKMGDGYEKVMKYGSPFTEKEYFVGVSARGLTEALKAGVVYPQEARLFFSATESALKNAKNMYGLDELYINYAHLVCREAVKGISDANADSSPSMSLHIDQPSSLSYRNFSSFLYLNEQFSGGELFFADQHTKSEDLQVEPRCGRMILFHSNEYHGVKAVTRGKRCALAMWFTTDKSHEEQSRAEAFKIVAEIEATGKLIEPPKPIGPLERKG